MSTSPYVTGHNRVAPLRAPLVRQRAAVYPSLGTDVIAASARGIMLHIDAAGHFRTLARADEVIE
jgi:hypothetical protein